MFREWNRWALQLKALFIIKKNTVFGGAESGWKKQVILLNQYLSQHPPPPSRHWYRKVNEVEISIVFCGHKPSTEVSWSHRMQKSLPSWLLLTRLGGDKLRNVGHKSLGIRRPPALVAFCSSACRGWPGVRDFYEVIIKSFISLGEVIDLLWGGGVLYKKN